MKHKFNYFYKITNTINGHFYYGIHSTDNLDDGYMGSGTRLKATYKKYGMENFEKEILKFFNTRKEASEYEAEMVTENLVKDVDCYNMKIGGDYGTTSGTILVKDKEGIFHRCTKNDTEYISGEWVDFMTGCVSVLEKETKETKIITQEEFIKNRSKYKTSTEDKVIVKDKYNNFYCIHKTDERYTNGELVGIWKGRHHTEKTKQKMRNTFKNNKHQQGEKNSQYGTCWITNGEINKKIKKEELLKYISNGWTKGRKIKFGE